jgi:putative transposase
MPRKSRIYAPGAVHHVIIRGIERSSIFKNSKDYENFISRLALLLRETSTSCYAWALMKIMFICFSEAVVFPSRPS